VPSSHLHHFRSALRQLRKSPGFTAVAVVALALGIGVNTAIFSVVYAVLLKPLPFPEQERLMFIREWSEQVPGMSVSYPNFVDWRERQQSFTAMGVVRDQWLNLTGSGSAERVAGALATHDLFEALQVQPLRGRLFSPADDRPGSERTALMRESLWRRSFGARESIIGESVQINGRPFTIIGVLPDAVQVPAVHTELWQPLGLFADQHTYQSRDNHPGLSAIARLKPGVSFDAARRELEGLAAQLAHEYPDSNTGVSVMVKPLTERVVGQVRPMLQVLLGAAGFVLLIACANVANLQLARAHSRAREFAVRAALGAGRRQIVWQLLTESLVLGALGGVAGLLLGGWALDAYLAVLPSNLPRLGEVQLNGWVLAFAIVMAVVTSLAFGLVPAAHAAKLDLRGTLAQGPSSGGNSAGSRWRSALIVAEFSLTSVLLIGAFLMLRTLGNLHRADPGFRTERVVTFGWGLPRETYDTAAARNAMLERALMRLAAVPGVTQAAFIDPLPLTGGYHDSGNQNGYYVQGAPLETSGRGPSTERIQVSRDYFSVMAIPLLSGRTFDERDTEQSQRVVIVDTTFVQKNFAPGENPIGRRLAFGHGPPEDAADWLEIVGVVEHIQNYTFGDPTREQAYIPHTQLRPWDDAFVVRTALDPTAVIPALRAAMAEIAPNLPIFQVTTMDQVFAASIATQRLTMTLLGTFSGLALLLATVGLYGVLTYSVGQRTREIGVRMALGAQSVDVVRLVVRHGLKLASFGLFLGFVAALFLTALLRPVLYGVSRFDLASFMGVGLTLLIIGVLACWLPARRATRVNPVEALRAE
jgi:putative ABC transport system permease protein